MCLKPSIPVIAYLLHPLQFCNLPLIAHNHHLQFAETATVSFHPNNHSRYFICSLLFVNLRTEISYFIVDGWFSFDLSSLMYYCLTQVNKAYDFYACLLVVHIHRLPFSRRGLTVMKVSILVLGFTLDITTICQPPTILLFI